MWDYLSRYFETVFFFRILPPPRTRDSPEDFMMRLLLRVLDFRAREDFAKTWKN